MKSVISGVICDLLRKAPNLTRSSIRRPVSDTGRKLVGDSERIRGNLEYGLPRYGALTTWTVSPYFSFMYIPLLMAKRLSIDREILHAGRCAFRGLCGATSECRSKYVDNDIYSPHCRKTSFEITYGDYHVYPYDPRCNYSSLHKQPGVVTNLSPSM